MSDPPRTLANDCGRLRTIANACEHKRNDLASPPGPLDPNFNHIGATNPNADTCHAHAMMVTPHGQNHLGDLGPGSSLSPLSPPLSFLLSLSPPLSFLPLFSPLSSLLLSCFSPLSSLLSAVFSPLPSSLLSPLFSLLSLLSSLLSSLFSPLL